MNCKDCEHFHIRMNPIKADGGGYWDLGLAECKKHNVVAQFGTMRQIDKLTCIERRPTMENDLIYRGSVKTKVSDTWWNEIDSIPAVDAVEVVRCRECEMANACSDEREMYCALHHAYKPIDYFCADGRREDGDA